MENPIKMDDLGVPPLKETPIWLNNYLGGGFKDVFFSPRNLGKIFTHFDNAYFSDRLVQPPTS